MNVYEADLLTGVPPVIDLYQPTNLYPVFSVALRVTVPFSLMLSAALAPALPLPI